MSRILSLRGEEFFDGIGTIEVTSFTNASPDRTKAWKVLDASIWVKQNTSNATAVVKTGSEYVVSMQLQTDGKRVGPDLSATDNRCFGWLRNLCRVSSGSGMLAQAALHEMKVIDPDHLITDQLVQQFCFHADSVGENAALTICWIVILQEVRVNPAEAILQLVKGKAQDVSN